MFYARLNITKVIIIYYLCPSKIIFMSDKIFFEEKGEELLKAIGMSKTEFANRMGIRKQNVKVLFKSKNIETIRRAAKVMNVPFEMLIGYTSEQNTEDLPTPPKVKETEVE